MAKVAFHLPGNRGILTGPEGIVIANETRRSQAAEFPREGSLYVSNVPPYVALSSLAPSAQVARFSLIPPVVDKITLSAARIRVTGVAVNPSSAQAQIYRLQSPSENMLRAVAGTKVTFNCSTTGQKEVALTKEVELLPGSRYFMGFWSSDALMNFAGHDNTNGTLLGAWTIGGTSLPDTVNFVSKSQTAYVLAVTYLTSYAKVVL